VNIILVRRSITTTARTKRAIGNRTIVTMVETEAEGYVSDKKVPLLRAGPQMSRTESSSLKGRKCRTALLTAQGLTSELRRSSTVVAQVKRIVKRPRFRTIEHREIG